MEDQPAEDQRMTYRVEEAAEVVGVHPLTLRAAIHRGEVPHVKVGRRILVPRKALEAWLDRAGQPVAG